MALIHHSKVLYIEIGCIFSPLTEYCAVLKYLIRFGFNADSFELYTDSSELNADSSELNADSFELNADSFSS